MGERSQIFIRYQVKNGRKFETKGFMAVHHQWSYGERMISRCRGIIEHLKYMGKFAFHFSSDAQLKVLRQVIDTNWDMRCIITSCDLVPEEVEWATNEPNHKVNVFNTDSNHGHIYVDIMVDSKADTYTIKYCFCDYWDAKPMNVLDFANHDMGNHNAYRDENEPLRNWDEPTDWNKNNIDGFNEMVKYTKENIDFINENATLMTNKEKNDFVKWGNNWVESLVNKAKTK